MDRRYQVFISSTFADLKEERQEIIQALLELDCIPSGMELFPAANEDQWSLIKRVIGDCDYYLLIMGGRYGSLGPDGISFTEMEYRYALEIGKPVIAFLHRNPAEIATGKSEATDAGKTRLEAFREYVQKRLCKFWSSPAELGSVVSRSLVQLIKTTPAIGWVRGDQVPDESSAIQIIQLHQTIKHLESKLAESEAHQAHGIENLARGSDKFSLKFRADVNDQYGNVITTIQNNPAPATWDEILATIGPSLLDGATEVGIGNSLMRLLEEKGEAGLKRYLRKENTQYSSIDEYDVDDETLETIIIQLRALGLIEKREGSSNVWTLTKHGDIELMKLRAIRN